MLWERLVDRAENEVRRGEFLLFSEGANFADKVIMVVTADFVDRADYSLVAVTGNKAGIRSFVELPKMDGGVLTKDWLLKNFNYWICQDCVLDEIYISKGLEVCDLYKI